MVVFPCRTVFAAHSLQYDVSTSKEVVSLCSDKIAAQIFSSVKRTDLEHFYQS